MTAQQRYEDISKRSGMSVDIVRAVLRAETESAIASLRVGESVNLAGRCSIKPLMSSKLIVGDTPQCTNVVKLKAKASSVLISALSDMQEFDSRPVNKEEDENLFKEVSIRQIPDLI